MHYLGQRSATYGPPAKSGPLSTSLLLRKTWPIKLIRLLFHFECICPFLLWKIIQKCCFLGYQNFKNFFFGPHHGGWGGAQGTLGTFYHPLIYEWSAWPALSIRIVVLAHINKKVADLWSRVSPYMNENKRRIIMKAFIQSQFGYCPAVWMCHSGALNSRINRIHERVLRFLNL